MIWRKRLLVAVVDAGTNYAEIETCLVFPLSLIVSCGSVAMQHGFQLILFLFIFFVSRWSIERECSKWQKYWRGVSRYTQGCDTVRRQWIFGKKIDQWLNLIKGIYRPYFERWRCDQYCRRSDRTRSTLYLKRRSNLMLIKYFFIILGIKMGLWIFLRGFKSC